VFFGISFYVTNFLCNLLQSVFEGLILGLELCRGGLGEGYPRVDETDLVAFEELAFET
jgi:hypothetical protein